MSTMILSCLYINCPVRALIQYYFFYYLYINLEKYLEAKSTAVLHSL